MPPANRSELGLVHPMKVAMTPTELTKAVLTSGLGRVGIDSSVVHCFRQAKRACNPTSDHKISNNNINVLNRQSP